MSSALTIGTHDGTFHCDEALAVYLLRVLPQYKQAKLIRTRDNEMLKQCSIIVDVGAVYDASSHRYDHHQRGFLEVFNNKYQTKLSSAGLIYKHFGKDVLRVLHPSLSEEDLELLYDKVYSVFIEALDGIDNGVTQYSGENLKQNYTSNTDLSSRVAKLNPEWHETCNNDEIDDRFVRASQLTGREFEESVAYYVRSWMPARDIVKRMIDTRFEVHPSGQILKMSQHTVWKSHLFQLEQQLGIAPVLYILYGEGGNSTKWRIQCVPASEQSFASRKALPEPWRGLRDASLDEVTHIKGGVFVHAAGFIGGAHSYEAAYQLAVKALEWSDNNEEANKKQKI